MRATITHEGRTFDVGVERLIMLKRDLCHIGSLPLPPAVRSKLSIQLEYAFQWDETADGETYWAREYEEIRTFGRAPSVRALDLLHTYLRLAQRALAGALPPVDPGRVPALDAATHADGKAFRVNAGYLRAAVAQLNGSLPADETPFDELIDWAFDWQDTPHGHDFWSAACERWLKGSDFSSDAAADALRTYLANLWVPRESDTSSGPRLPPEPWTVPVTNPDDFLI